MSTGTFVKVAGRSFSCSVCGSNMFTRRDAPGQRYECNGCGACYIGEEAQQASVSPAETAKDGK